MPRTYRALAVVVLLVLGVACVSPDAEIITNEILWDTWGVPHIRGESDEALFRGMGWAHMEGHGDLMLKLYGEARGRASEYWGEEYLESDQFLRTMGVPDRGAEWLAAESPEMRRNLEAFAAGANAYAESHPEQISDRVKVVLPVSASDVLAHMNRAIHFTFVTDPGVVRRAKRALSRPVGASLLDDASVGRERFLGSNAWAIGPSRSASGNTILVGNPHLPWEDLFTWFEIHITGPGVDAYGGTLVGLPGIALGFNDRLGWTHTVNTYDGADLYVLELDGAGYRFGDEVREFETREAIVRVADGDGSLREIPMQVRSSIHGPVIAEGGGRAVALRVAGLENGGATSQWWEMARARNVEEFEAALARLQIPMMNVIYADADGHILYVFNGAVPDRARGDVAMWAGAVDGSDPSTLWTSYHAYSDLPRLLDPAAGWVQNANEPPWTATVPIELVPADYPAYLSPMRMEFRPQRSANMLRGDDSITLQEAVEYKHSTVSEVALRVLDELVAAARATDNPEARAAAEVLAAWDRTLAADSRGGLLFEAWHDQWRRSPEHWRTPWSVDAPADTPRGLADPESAVATLAAVATDLRHTRGTLDTPWGEVHRARRGNFDVAVSGGPGGLGLFRVAVFGAADPDGRRSFYHGDSYYFVTEFTPDGVDARVLLAYGNATQPGSPHLGDQLGLFAQQRMRTPWLTISEIEANLALRTVLPAH